MALNLANVELTDTFNTWRVRTNSVIGEAVSGTSTTSQTITANVEFSGTVTVPTLNATTVSTSGTVSAGDFSGNGASVTSVDAVTLDGIDSASFLRSDAADAKTSGDLTFNDNVKAVFGTGSDLEIFHDASDSIINDAGTGNLKIQTGGTDRVEATSAGGSLYGNWTVTQSLTIDGDATFNGNTTLINVTEFTAEDTILHLGANNAADTVDQGVVMMYVRGDGQNTHAGFIRDSGTKEIYFFNEAGTGEAGMPFTSFNPGAGDTVLANVHASFFKGDGSQLTNAGSTVAQEVHDTAADRDLFVPFTGISSGTMTSANVALGLVYNPATGTLTANNFVGDGSGLSGAGSTLANDAVTNSDLNVVFTGLTTGSLTSANVASGVFTFNPSTGTCSATVFNATSDERAKENIRPINDPLNKVLQLQGVDFTWKKNGEESTGLIAQQVEEILPQVVTQDSDGMKGINYGALVGVLIEAIKELNSKIEN